jgi:hypothetical protein
MNDRDQPCGTYQFYSHQKGTYGLCRPSGPPLPWWAVKKIDKMQTNVRPDEGYGCLARVVRA